jgi:phage protein U
MQNMRDLAAQGEPQLLLDSRGNIYGHWVITNIEETRSVFAAFTQPRKIEFSVTLQKFDGDSTNLPANLVATAINAL